MKCKHDIATELVDLSRNPLKGFLKIAIVTVVGCVFLFLVAFVPSWILMKTYDGKILPNVFVGSLSVGNMTQDDAQKNLNSRIDEIMNTGVSVVLNQEAPPKAPARPSGGDQPLAEKILPLSTLIGSDLVDNVHFQTDQTIKKAFSVGRSQNEISDTLNFLVRFVRPIIIPIDTSIQEDNINANVVALFPEVDNPVQNAKFVFAKNNSIFSITAKEGIVGSGVDTTTFLLQLKNQLEQLDASTIELTIIKKGVLISVENVKAQIPQVSRILESAPFVFVFKSDDGEKRWELNSDKLSSLLIPGSDKTVSIDQKVFDAFLDTIAVDVEQLAQDARFQIQNNRATEFVQSQNGIKLDREQVYRDAIAAVRSVALERSSPVKTISLITIIEKPKVTIAEINQLGITDKLGVGTSNYKGSPSNRKKNIQNGVRLLNGLLIAPDETFSLINALKPFTKGNGYLPELVIKGEKIVPEVGGGLCQIGTTTFRAVMNSGLPIVERQNHSLVVSYYNDPANKNPGTDATVYDPAPDFKFKNDTGQYILFQAENLTDKQQLRFTFWGTSDGRKGSYTPPKVLSWIPAGQPQITETTDLKPGEEKCQEMHIGANATFTYSITHPDGKIETQKFDSHYRPLPKICLVGVDPEKQKAVEIIPQTNSETVIPTPVPATTTTP